MASFLFFLYVTFPYGVIKEVIVDRVTQEIQKSGTPVRLSIGSLEPYWFTGIELENVSLTNITLDAANLRLGKVRVYVNPFAVILGRIGVSVYLTQVGGSAAIDIALPILSLIKGAPSPSQATVELKSFSLDPFFNHALALAAGSKDPAMILIAPLVNTTKIGGNLSGTINFKNSNTEHFGNAKGNFELSIADGFLHIDDQTLKIRKQSFTTANLDLSFENNALVLGNQTKFAAEDIEISLNGRITLPDLSKQPPQANLNFELTMRDKIQDSLGFIVPNMLRCPALTNGTLKANLAGPISAMVCTGQ
jgi:type II secretion system protein N